jgi:hypothetical protein
METMLRLLRGKRDGCHEDDELAVDIPAVFTCVYTYHVGILIDDAEVFVGGEVLSGFTLEAGDGPFGWTPVVSRVRTFWSKYQGQTWLTMSRALPQQPSYRAGEQSISRIPDSDWCQDEEDYSTTKKAHLNQEPGWQECNDNESGKEES